jgi:hypothetical protein
MDPKSTSFKTLSQREILILITLIIIAGLVFQLRVALTNSDGRGVDFNQFYSAGKLTGTGHLYEWEALRKLEAAHGSEVPTGRLPVVLYGHKILGILPYSLAQFAWAALNVAAFLVFAFAWPGTWRPLTLAALAWSLPAGFILLFGQDTAFWLMFFAAGLLLMERKRPWLAGVAFSLCICKFHLALGIPVMVAAQKRWNTMGVAAISVLLLIASCFLIEGPQWPLRYLEMSKMAAFAPPPDVMPTISALTVWLPWPVAAQLVGSVALGVLLWVVCRRVPDAGMAGAATAACGLLVAPHALFADTALLIPLAVLTIRRPTTPRWLQALAVLTLSPLPFLFSTALHKSLIWQLLVAPFVVFAAVAAANKPEVIAGP